jgi:cytochrome P450
MNDPYPTWKRLRDEAPLHYNEKYDLYALTCYEDVQRVSSTGARTTRVGVLCSRRSRQESRYNRAASCSRTPPAHDEHRKLLARVFTPRRMAEIEPKVREFCARSLEPLVERGGFDFVADRGAEMPMRTIGMLLGIPETDQEAIRDRIDDSLRLRDGIMMPRRCPP